MAIVGAREYIFSENIGILGDVAAGKEQTFGTLAARSMATLNTTNAAKDVILGLVPSSISRQKLERVWAPSNHFLPRRVPTTC